MEYKQPFYTQRDQLSMHSLLTLCKVRKTVLSVPYMKMFWYYFLAALHVIIFTQEHAQAQTRLNNEGWKFGIKTVCFSNTGQILSPEEICIPRLYPKQTWHIFPTKSQTRPRTKSKMLKCVDNSNRMTNVWKQARTIQNCCCSCCCCNNNNNNT